MADDYPYPKLLQLDLDDIMISATHGSYPIAIQVIDYYHQQAVIMSPEEQATYVRFVRESYYVLSPTNRSVPRNNRLWKYLVQPGNSYCRAHFVMLAATYGIDKLNALQPIVELAGDIFEVRDLSQYYNHYYFPSTPSPPAEEHTLTNAVSTNQPSTSNEVPGCDTSLLNNILLLSPVSVFLSAAPATVENNEPQSAPLPPPRTINPQWDPFQPEPPSPITIASASPSPKLEEPNSALVEPTNAPRPLTPDQPVISADAQPRSPSYSPQYERTPADEIAELKERIRQLEGEKAILLQLLREQGDALYRLQ